MNLFDSNRDDLSDELLTELNKDSLKCKTWKL